MPSFPKSSRVLLRRDYLRAVSGSNKYVGNLIFIDFFPNGKQFCRLGITVTKKYGNSCKRNRFKRISREAFRLSNSILPKGWDILVRPRKHALQATTADIQDELQNGLNGQGWT